MPPLAVTDEELNSLSTLAARRRPFLGRGGAIIDLPRAIRRSLRSTAPMPRTYISRGEVSDRAIHEANPAEGLSVPSMSRRRRGALHLDTLSRVAAIDEATGETKWVFDLKIMKTILARLV
jgi:hypothetical protein